MADVGRTHIRPAPLSPKPETRLVISVGASSGRHSLTVRMPSSLARLFIRQVFQSEKWSQAQHGATLVRATEYCPISPLISAVTEFLILVVKHQAATHASIPVPCISHAE